ncbi:hypothetical protein BC830DRAFT_33433 [Chytriomyces sp. MP71]|nr:hypothetical protein BC830DRAFT_33433 [Chytriomyces sp. MP71]
MSYRNNAPPSRSRSGDEGYTPRGKSFDSPRSVERYRDGAPASGNGGSSKWAAAANAAEENARNGGGSKYAGWENVHEEDDNYDDEGWLARKTRSTQNESRDTTRRALQKLYAAEEVGQKSLNQLNQQSEQLHRIEHRLETADSHAKISEAKASELKALNRWFFLPTFGASKKAASLEDKHKREMTEAEVAHEARKEVARNGGGYYSGRNGGREDLDSGRSRSNGDLRGAGRNGDRNDRDGSRNGGGVGYGKSYSTPDGLERDSMEEEIDNNLDEISSGLQRLKMMGQTMGQEITHQTDHIRKISDRTDSVRDRVDKVHRDISKFAPKEKEGSKRGYFR